MRGSRCSSSFVVPEVHRRPALFSQRQSYGGEAQIHPQQDSIDGDGELYRSLEEPNRLAKTSTLLKRIGKDKKGLLGRFLHHHVIECGHGWQILLGNCLMQMYGRCGLVQEAQCLFDRIPNPDSYAWNILINVYGHNKGICDAIRVFGRMPFPNVVSWNVVVTLLSSNGRGQEALDHFLGMQARGILPNDVTCIAMMEACSMLASLREGNKIHAIIVGNASYGDNILVATSLINMYGRCGCAHGAKSVFDVVRRRDVVTWTAMIGCLSQNGLDLQALEHFQTMEREGVPPNDITFICAMEASASLASLDEGHDLHTRITCIAFENEVKVSNALIDMYSKCGSLGSALHVFGSIARRSVVSWNAMIVAFGQHGLGREASSLFRKMQSEGIKPDSISFIAVMNACSHNGLVEEGLWFFLSMEEGHGHVHIIIDHYVCVIDLLGRAGRLDEAESAVRSIPCEGTVVAWLCLLACCRIHGDVERGSSAANHCFRLDPEHGAPYIVLSNLYYTGLIPADVKE